MGLRNLKLKKQYRSDRDDIVSEFFIPCLEASYGYDRTIEYVSVKSLLEYYVKLEMAIQRNPRIRIVTGYHQRITDLNLLSVLFNGDSKTMIRLKKNQKDMDIIVKLRDLIKTKKLEIKVAIPNSEEVYGRFSEKIGIFKDEYDDIVAFTGSLNETFAAENKNFESIDVFTSWNEKDRVETKINDFENLWLNKTNYVQVYDFSYAVKNNLLKYSAEWVFT